MECIEFLDNNSLEYNNLNKKFINHIDKSRYSIIMNSEETDIYKSYALYLLYWISNIENNNKKVFIISPDYNKVLEIKLELLLLSKKIGLPISVDGEKFIKFENGIEVKIYKLHKNTYIPFSAHLGICVDIGEAPNHIFKESYKYLFPTISALKDSKLIINSSPNGHNLFYKIFTDAEEGINSFSSLRLYYWEDNNKDGDWVKEKISSIGEEEFNRRYNLVFTSVKGERKNIDIN